MDSPIHLQGVEANVVLKGGNINWNMAVTNLNQGHVEPRNSLTNQATFGVMSCYVAIMIYNLVTLYRTYRSPENHRWVCTTLIYIDGHYQSVTVHRPEYSQLLVPAVVICPVVSGISLLGAIEQQTVKHSLKPCQSLGSCQTSNSCLRNISVPLSFWRSQQSLFSPFIQMWHGCPLPSQVGHDQKCLKVRCPSIAAHLWNEQCNFNRWQFWPILTYLIWFINSSVILFPETWVSRSGIPRTHSYWLSNVTIFKDVFVMGFTGLLVLHQSHHLCCAESLWRDCGNKQQKTIHRIEDIYVELIDSF